MSNVSPQTQPPTVQSLAVWNPVRGIWYRTKPDLFGQQEQLYRPGGYVDRSRRARSRLACLARMVNINRGLGRPGPINLGRHPRVGVR